MNDEERNTEKLTKQWYRFQEVVKQIKMIETRYPWFKVEPKPDPYTGLLEEVPWETDEEQAIYSKYASLKAQREELTIPLIPEYIPF